MPNPPPPFLFSRELQSVTFYQCLVVYPLPDYQYGGAGVWGVNNSIIGGEGAQGRSRIPRP